MREENLQTARSLIEQSRILSSVERAEWLQLLPLMNDQQMGELVKILQSQPGPASRPSRPPGSSFQPQRFSLPDISELELPPPPKPPIATQAEPVKPAAKSSQPENVAAILEHIKAMQDSHSASAPVQNPAPHPFPYPSAHLQTKPAVPAQKIQLDLRVPEDLKKLSPAILHGNNPYDIFQKILNFIAEQSKNISAVAMIQYLDRSPLQQVYMQTGISLLNSQDADRESAYGKIVEAAKRNGSQYLAKEEFEAYADFRKEIDKI